MNTSGDRDQPRNPARRRLLAGASLAGLAAAAGGATPAAAGNAIPPDGRVDPRRLDYEETEHVRSAYRCMRL